MTVAAVVDGRFLTMQLTGVQRYSRELLARLPAHLTGDVVVAVPPGRLIDAADRDAVAAIPQTATWHGLRGHGWEQVRLPALVRRAGSRVPLLSPASWGPVAVRRQIVVVHDILPRLHGHHFQPAYRVLSAVLTPAMVHSCNRLATPSSRVRDDLVRWYGADRDRVDVVPPGIGEPFTAVPLHGIEDHGRRGRYCVMVGGHDRRKNIGFVLGWWPEVHRELGLELIVTTRGTATTRVGEELNPIDGVTYVMDPDDTTLAQLYAAAECLLWPSLGEGFGLPLLEAMASGTPFLSTDVGAARELAVEPQQVLPLDAEMWKKQLRAWCEHPPVTLRTAGATRARAFTWDATAAATVRALQLVQ